MPPLLRSLLAVILGFMAMMVLSIALTLVMIKAMGLRSGHPTPGYLVFNAAASALASFLGGFVTGSIAAERRVRHGYILALVILIMGALSYVHYTGQQALWYQGFMVILPAAVAVLGAKAAQLRALRA